MTRQNLHTHTVFCDGKNTPLEMARAALDAGLSSLGFSGHSPLPWDNDWGMTPEKVPAYKRAVAAAREQFAGRLEVYCGIEWDSLSAPEVEGFDFVIGSVHHVSVGSGVEPPAVDDSPEITRAALGRYFGGDPLRMAEAYFTGYRDLAARDFVDVVGHFDLLTKFDEKEGIFPGDHPRFLEAAVAAMELLLRKDKLFEVNTGAISRGWRTSPYPSRRLLEELRRRNARVLISSDAHSADAVACAFPETEELLRSVGFREIWHLGPGGFAPVPLD